MKRFIFVLLFSTVALFSLSSCGDNKKAVMEDVVLSVLKAPKTYDMVAFEKTATITLGDEIQDRVDHYTFRKSIGLAADDMLKFLESVRSENDLTAVTFTEYTLTYDAENSFGVPVRDKCVGRFDKDGNLVAIKVAEDSDWDLIGNFFSIPGYYDRIK